MRRSLWFVLIAAHAALFSVNSFAEESCPVQQGEDAPKECQNPGWRDQATMSDDSSVRITDVAENVERILPKSTAILWALPPVPMATSQVYADDELKAVKLKLTTTSPQFRSAKANLDPAVITRVVALVEELKDKKNVRLSFVGHTDNQHLSLKTQRWFKDNQALSEARAKAVAAYFQQELGLSDSAITTSGKGDAWPIASNSTPAGMAKNRRVEMAIWYDDIVPGKVTTVETSTMNRRLICSGEAVPVSTPAGGFRISIDGQPVDNGAKDGEDVQRCTDVALSQTNVRLQYDNLSDKPMLDVSAWQATATAGETIQFQAYSNYLAWIDHAEVRIFADGRSVSGEPLAVVALSDSLTGEWAVPTDASKEMQYRLRVYDKKGRFDETTTLPLWRAVAHDLPEDDQLTAQQSEMIAYGKTRLARQSIPVSGGTVTVHGDAVPANHQIVVMGQQVPVDTNGKFVVRQIIPNGRHTIEVAALDAQGNGALYWRDIEFKNDDWFYVGLVDVTAGRYRSHGAAEEVTQDKQHLANNNFVDGRLAFYTKGKWRNKYTVTASADTREQPLRDIFSTFMDKDPRALLRRLGDSEYYPTYGDDSTLVEDAPTQGKFYAKIEDERSQAMWGNFKIVQQETDLAQINRGLYGAVVDWNSEAITSDSESKTNVNVFAAEPGTLATREEFRGTGGTLFYLGHQDIVTGSERVQVEVRDKDSGIVLSVNTLVAGQDYQEDAIQGRIALTRPLPSASDDSALVRAGNYIGHPVYLVVDYEYIASLERIRDLAVGGRATHWVNDSVRLGITGSHQQQGQQDQNLGGLDVLFRKTPETYLRLEAARTEGPGVTSNGSFDGGFTFSPTAINPTNNNESANAYQLESGFRLNDLGFERDGNGHFYARNRDDGFSAPGQLTTYDTKQFGGALTLPLTEKDSLDFKVDLTHQKNGFDTETAEIDYRHKLNDTWTLSAGLRGDKREDDTNTTTDNVGDRTDLALQANYQSDADWGMHAFVQGTLHHSDARHRNNRGGLGGNFRINDRLGMNGEISSGSGGFGALIGADYRLSDRTTTYLNYALDPDNANTGIGNRQGKLVSGARTRYSDWVSVYGEEQYLHGDNGNGLTHAYGIDLTPDESWKIGLGIEIGRLNQNSSGEIKRRAATLAVDYAQDAIKYGGSLELRRDEINNDVRNNISTRNHLSYQLTPDWRVRGALDLAFSDSDGGSFLDANFVEAILGYAYRPVNNDKFNMLLEYKFLSDQSPANQFTASGSQNQFEQRSHVFAIDGIYDLSTRWSLGAKYAIRKGELRAGRGSGDWFDSTAQLGVLRLDWHVVKHWDALIEGRVLDIREAEDRRAGMLLAVYRHLGDHVKAGVGYNFTDFSDDLTNLDYDSRGVFFNVIGKW